MAARFASLTTTVPMTLTAKSMRNMAQRCTAKPVVARTEFSALPKKVLAVKVLREKVAIACSKGSSQVVKGWS